MIHVGVNLAWIDPGRVGGSEEYAVRLLRAVGASDLDDDLTLHLLARGSFFEAYPDLARWRSVGLAGPMSRPWRILAESTVVRRRTTQLDLVHHMGGRLPARRARRPRHVVTVHDLQPIDLPEHFSTTKRRYLGWAIPRSVRHAAAVSAPSRWVASTIVDTYGLDASIVTSIPSTWDDDDHIDRSLADRYEGRRVVLYPAVTHPHKNHLALLDAFDELSTRVPDAMLVLTGAAGATDDAVVERIAAGRGAVDRLGRVDAAALRGLLRRADVLAFPSAYEGFGLPVLEAMRAGTPVVAGPSEAVAEVMGGTGTHLRDLAPGTWAGALTSAMDTAPDALAAARERAEFYSPERAAARLVAFWRSAL
ncbi:MAG: glycosyltransferase family 1 protein [Actinomycetota bacterium]